MARAVGQRDVLRSGLAGAGMWLGGLSIRELVESLPQVPAQPFSRAKKRPDALDDPAYLTIAEASQLIRTRRLSPVELVDTCLSRIERVEPSIKAWITVFSDRARAEARAAADEIARRGPTLPVSRNPDRP